MTVHVPILVKRIVDALVQPFRELAEDAESHWIVDCTLGGGGHTQAFLHALAQLPGGSKHGVIAFDQDESAIHRAHERFESEIQAGRLQVIHSPMSQASGYLKGKKILGLMADLGFSSDQIEDPQRGLSFLREGPLDMRLDPRRGMSAYQFLRTASETEIANVIYELGEERFSRRIAAAIVQARGQKALPETTTAFADLVVRAVPPPARKGKIHAATRTFQALRIYVNEELEELDTLLGEVISTLPVGGRVAILSFHSLEDRKVKGVFKDREGIWSPLTKKPIEADEEEVSRNPRSRSAKLRIAERKQKEAG